MEQTDERGEAMPTCPCNPSEEDSVYWLSSLPGVSEEEKERALYVTSISSACPLPTSAGLIRQPGGFEGLEVVVVEHLQPDDLSINERPYARWLETTGTPLLRPTVPVLGIDRASESR